MISIICSQETADLVLLVIRWSENATDATYNAVGRQTTGLRPWIYIGSQHNQYQTNNKCRCCHYYWYTAQFCLTLCY